ncbi:MAG: hypothetical protein ACPHJ3_09605, partial [Rubripirellula sp.]
MSHIPRCQDRDRRDSEWQLKTGILCENHVRVVMKRFRFVLIVVCFFAWDGLFDRSTTSVLAQDAGESQGVEEAGGEVQKEGGDDTGASADADQANANEPSENRSLWIPAVLPDGRRITPIGMYQSQMDELVPKNYHPVSLEQLNLAIAKWTARATDDQTSRLKGAVYWVRVVGDTLVSDKSILDIESDRTDQVRRSLGKINLAIEQPRGFSPGNTIVPRMESESDGNVVAVFRGDEISSGSSAIWYSWNMRGTKTAYGYVFDLKIPRAPQAKFYFSMPSGTLLRTEQGVLRLLSEPPLETGDVAEANELADMNDSNWEVGVDWYELDAGGLDTVTLHTQLQPSNSAPKSFVVRRSQMQYEVDRHGLKWVCKMVIQVPEAWEFPELFIGDATV